MIVAAPDVMRAVRYERANDVETVVVNRQEIKPSLLSDDAFVDSSSSRNKTRVESVEAGNRSASISSGRSKVPKPILHTDSISQVDKVLQKNLSHSVSR